MGWVVPTVRALGSCFVCDVSHPPVGTDLVPPPGTGIRTPLGSFPRILLIRFERGVDIPRGGGRGVPPPVRAGGRGGVVRTGANTRGRVHMHVRSKAMAWDGMGWAKQENGRVARPRCVRGRVPASHAQTRARDPWEHPRVAMAVQSPLLRPTNGKACPKPKEALEVRGGSVLEGHARISGAKNSALAVLAGTLLCGTTSVLRMVPELRDIRRMCDVLESIGAKVEIQVDERRTGGGASLIVDASRIHNPAPAEDAVRSLRASFFVLGPLLARLKEAVVPLPGGCDIGARPVDLHVRGLEALGAQIEIKHGCVHATTRGLVGAKIYLDYPSVGATETLMMAAALADGETTIENVAQEPEVVDLANYLVSMGACVRGAGTNSITINGVKKLHETEFTVIPDRIEAGTFLVAGAITHSSITLSPVIPRHLTAVIAKLHSIGCKVSLEGPDCVRLTPAEILRPADITTMPFPGFPTDMQPQFMALLTQSNGTSVVRETVFENRMKHVQELQRLGAHIKLSGSQATVDGGYHDPAAMLERHAAVIEVTGRRDVGALSLSGTHVKASDLRAGAALLLAGLAAEGTTTIEGLHHMDRGYERLDEKLCRLGADVRRVVLPDS